MKLLSLRRLLKGAPVRRLLAIAALLPMGVLMPEPAIAAERVIVSLGIFEISLSIDTLRRYADTGEKTGDLVFYSRFLDDRSEAQLRQILRRSVQISPVPISQLTNSQLGELFLNQLGNVLRTETGQNGAQALRAAVLLAASEPEGLTVLNALESYPSEAIRIQARDVLTLVREGTAVLDYRDAAVRALVQQEDAELAASPAPNFSQLPDLRQPGSVPYSKRTIELNRDRRSPQGTAVERRFEVDLYIPEGLSQPAPVVVISHGLGSDRSAFAYLGEHLASHGIAAVVPQHIGSDASRREGVIAGVLRSPANPVEFLDRPFDITFTLDALEQLARTDANIAQGMNLQQVGVIGHSFGGYTALALAGAPLNVERLQRDCAELVVTLNASPLLQCLAANLPRYPYYLRDSRIKAAIALSPLVSSVFGPEGMAEIQVPTFIMGGSSDAITSVIEEQIHPFLWLKTPQKYLAIMVPSGHTLADATDSDDGNDAGFSALGEFLSGPDPELGRTYMKALSLAFIQTHLAGNEAFKPFLSAGYSRYIAREPLELDFVRSLTAEQLETAFDGPPPVPFVPPLLAEVTGEGSRTLRAIARSGELRAAVRRDAPPFSYATTGGPQTGYCVDLIQALTQHIQQTTETPIRLELRPESTLDNRFELVQSGEVQLECGPNTIQSDRTDVTFSTPFFITGTHLLVERDRATELNPASQLSGVRIGVLSNSIHQPFVSQRYPNAQSVIFPDRPAAVQALTQNQIDAVASDGILLLSEMSRLNVSPQNYTLVPERPLTCAPYGLILPGGDRQWNAYVSQFIGSTTAREIWQKWFQGQYAYVLLSLDSCVDR